MPSRDNRTHMGAYIRTSNGSVRFQPRVWQDHQSLTGHRGSDNTTIRPGDPISTRAAKQVGRTLSALTSEVVAARTPKAKRVRAICTFCGDMGSKVDPETSQCRDAKACIKRRVNWE